MKCYGLQIQNTQSTAGQRYYAVFHWGLSVCRFLLSAGGPQTTHPMEAEGWNIRVRPWRAHGRLHSPAGSDATISSGNTLLQTHLETMFTTGQGILWAEVRITHKIVTVTLPVHGRWSGTPFPSSGDFPEQGCTQVLHLLHWQASSSRHHLGSPGREVKAWKLVRCFPSGSEGKE